MTTPPGLWIEYRPLAEIAKAPRNPKAHDLKTLRQSFQRFGYVAPVILDERTGQLVAGHGRLDALAAAKAAGQAPPDRVRVEGDEWLVPVVRGVDFANPREAESYLLADNQLAIESGWTDGLEAMLLDLRDADVGALFGTGFSDADLAKMLGEDTRRAPRADLAHAAELVARYGVALGQRWAIGQHRLACGDSTNAATVAHLFGDERADLFATDPPYLVDYTGGDRPDGSGKDWSGTYREVDIPDALTFYRSTFTAALAVLAPRAAWYVWHAHKRAAVIEQVWAELGILNHQQIVWVKPTALHSYAFYPWQHEPCLMGWRRGHKPPHDGDNSHALTSVWTVDWDGATRPIDNEHPTEKPIELFTRPIRKHTAPGAICYEPFSGSGTQLVAAELTGRRCYALEIQPAYVAIALDRLAAMGLTPTLMP
jgi:DNA modification methylase